MKRSEMIKILQDNKHCYCISPSIDIDFYTLLEIIEESGMLPPINTDDDYVWWEAPCGEEVCDLFCKWEEE